ncbi:MAG: CoA activase [Spirochaetales bacterium]|nr:MAG: CoA activase [Spirochaetales bacterium]
MKNVICLGLDVGSTTVKAMALDSKTGEILYSAYKRHNLRQAECLLTFISDLAERFPGRAVAAAVCGSGGSLLAERLGIPFIQEVLANTLAIRRFYPETLTAVELGGQDAKIIFYTPTTGGGPMIADDMRMNGICAGGTGAFIDQIAELLHTPPEEFGRLAEKGTRVYDISGRCGVFAKTDIQPLLNQGALKEDIALSCFHAIVKQTLGGLAQGREIKAPVLLQRGPVVFNPTLAQVFRDRLGLAASDVSVPEQKELFIALGAALSLDSLLKQKRRILSFEELNSLLEDSIRAEEAAFDRGDEPLFTSRQEAAEFFSRHGREESAAAAGRGPLDVFPPGFTVSGYLGIDVGSTTTKFVLIDEQGSVLYRFYGSNEGSPLEVLKDALLGMHQAFRRKRLHLSVSGAGTTGYGEEMAAAGFSADYRCVETVAHAEAAQHFHPGVSFILDVGGQDMKAIYLADGVITNIMVNEACSAGCGSFIETFGKSLGIPVRDIAPLAFGAKSPARLGSRCTVFMNSSIITAQKNGKSTGDIMAGICSSVVENMFTKVLRVSNFSALGDRILVQGGTFKNDAVLRAFEKYIGKTVVRPPHPEEMGALGTALLTKKAVEKKARKKGLYHSSFLTLPKLQSFGFTLQTGVVCPLCANSCMRTIIRFSGGRHFVTGNRCPKGEFAGGTGAGFDFRGKRRPGRHKSENVPDLLKLQNRLLWKEYPVNPSSGKKNLRIGIPRILDFWASMPFWRTLFSALGFEVVLSPNSSAELYEKGLAFVPSDTVCFPAKLAHGHIRALAEAGADRIFMPMMVRVPRENRSATGTHMCSIVQGYPMVVARSDDPQKRYGIPFDTPVFHWENEKLKYRQTMQYFSETFGIPRIEVFRALKEADKAFLLYKRELVEAGRKVIDSLGRSYPFAVVLAGRPYHSDEMVNHRISSHFTRLGIPVLVLEALPNLHDQNLSGVRVETTIPFHTRMLGGTFCTAKNPLLELVQIVSFGCGHDAVLSDEMSRILKESVSRKEMLILKLDETDIQGPLKLRVQSFVETILLKKEHYSSDADKFRYRELKSAFSVKFKRRDKRDKTVLAPNLSPGFSTVISAVLKREGFSVYQMPLAGQEAIDLGKRYVHNDMCYPAQINIGEALSLLKNGRFSPGQVALGLAKNCDDCRAGQYAVIARKALDEAGYPEVPIMTSGSDTKRMHPGARFGIRFQINMIWGLSFLDGLEMMRRRLRPYEKIKGRADSLFQEFLTGITEVLAASRKKALALFEEAVGAFNRIPLITDPASVAEERRRPRVGIVGEILVNYHPGSNRHIEQYLENQGMEVVIPPLLDFFRRGYVIDQNKALRRLVPHPLGTYLGSTASNDIIGIIKAKVGKILSLFRFPYSTASIRDLVRNIEGLIDISYIVGEGWLMPAEIIQMIKDGVTSFVIVQPFGCLPNHITGRGMIKAIKNIYPQVRIISLDYEPDISMANVENRLQMLIMSAREHHGAEEDDFPLTKDSPGRDITELPQQSASPEPGVLSEHVS